MWFHQQQQNLIIVIICPIYFVIFFFRALLTLDNFLAINCARSCADNRKTKFSINCDCQQYPIKSYPIKSYKVIDEKSRITYFWLITHLIYNICSKMAKCTYEIENRLMGQYISAESNTHVCTICKEVNLKKWKRVIFKIFLQLLYF